MNLRIGSLVVAALLVIGVVGSVMALAIPRPPSLPALSGGADPPPGRVAWMTWGQGGRCLHVLAPDGELDRDCDLDLDGELQGWRDGQLVVTGYDDGRSRLTIIDPDTGQRRTRPAEEGDRDRSGLGPDLRTHHEDGRLEVRVDGRQVWTVAADPAYDVRRALVSADGGTLLLLDAADRLLVAPADGSSAPRVWATDVPSWSGPVWEAADTGS